MATRIFRVDLSEGEGDFTATATEPGLAMLDRQGANYLIMQRWFGNLVAEPSWQGSSVNFYVQAAEGGRLEDIECHPVSKEDLEGPLKEPLMQIQARIKRAKPEGAAEVSLHRVVRSTFNNLTKDLEQSDYDCYFFKYRVGRDPWKLVWGWGYQRADHEPSPGLICTNDDCNQLFVRRPNQRPRCPGCEATVVTRRKGAAGIFLSPRNMTVAIGLLLLLIGLLLYFFGQPKLVAEPAEWSGPLGSRVAYRVHEKSWFIFNTDVTDKIVPVSSDPRVMQFDRTGVTARARGQGRASVTFQYGDKAVNATAVVGPPKPPDWLEFDLEGNGVELAVGATRQLRVWGKYRDVDGKKIDPVDFTDLITQWEVADGQVAHDQGHGKLEGIAEGKTEVRALYEVGMDPAKAEVTVVRGDYKELKVKLDPALVRRGETAQVEVVGIDAKGHEYSLDGSSQLRLTVEPEAAATLDGSYVVGKTAGKAEIKAKLGELAASFPFEVSSESIVPAGTFVVQPSKLNMAVYEYFKLDVLTPDEAPITLTSSDDEVVRIVGERGLAALKMGTAKVTVKQGDKSQTVDVNVNSTIQQLRIEPPLIALRVGEKKLVRVLGRVNVDKVDERDVEVAPELLDWVNLPRYDTVEVDRKTLIFRGLQATSDPQTVRVALGTELSAGANVTVSGSTTTTVASLDFEDGFVPYPPINRHLIWGGLQYDAAQRGLLLSNLAENSPLYQYRSRLPKGTVITGVGDVDFSTMSQAEIDAYFRAHPQLVSGETIRYRLPGQTDVNTFSYLVGGAVEAVGYRDAHVLEESADTIQFALDVYFDRLAQYRFTDRDGNPFPGDEGQWHTFGPEATEKLTSPRVPVTPSGTYNFYFQRRIGDEPPEIISINFGRK